MAETRRNNLIYAQPLTAIATTSQSLSHVLATASSERDGGHREGTTQRMRPVSAAARVARHIQRRFGMRGVIRAGARELEWGVSFYFNCHAKN